MKNHAIVRCSLTKKEKVSEIGKTNKQKRREEIGSSQQLNFAPKVLFWLFPFLLHLGIF